MSVFPEHPQHLQVGVKIFTMLRVARVGSYCFVGKSTLRCSFVRSVLPYRTSCNIATAMEFRLAPNAERLVGMRHKTPGMGQELMVVQHDACYCIMSAGDTSTQLG